MNKYEDNKKKIPKRVSLSATKGYEKEVAYLGEQPNKSQYVWNLIRKDIEQQTTDNRILEIVHQAMSNITLGAVVNNPQTQSKIVNENVNSTRKKGAMSILQD